MNLCFSLKEKFISMNRFIVPNLVNLVVVVVVVVVVVAVVVSGKPVAHSRKFESLSLQRISSQFCVTS